MYYIMAEKFGWTPAQVDDLPAPMADWFVAISGMMDEVRAERLEQR